MRYCPACKTVQCWHDHGQPGGDTLPRLEGGVMIELTAVLAEISTRIDASYPADMPEELVLRRRVGKVGVENGEMLDSLEGYTGENVRKGVYATRQDVIKELLDCASSALCAVEHMTGNEGLALSMFEEQVRSNLLRLQALA